MYRRAGVSRHLHLASYVSAVTFDSRFTGIIRSPFLRDDELTLILIIVIRLISTTFAMTVCPLRPSYTRLETRGMPIGISLMEPN